MLKYDFRAESKLKKKLKELDAWTDENVCKTIADKLNIPVDNTRVVRSLEEYINFVDELGDNNYVSRGQKDCTYDLNPSLYRLYDDGLGKHAAQYEEMFRQRIMYYDENVANKNDAELRAYGQHFGLPTNYLDFTEAHLISLLFAVEEYMYLDNHSIVYFVDALSYNVDNIQHHEKFVNFSDREEQSRIQKKYSDNSYFIRVGNCNERIHFQRGCFLKVEPGNSLIEMLSKYIKVVIIDKACKKAILKDLFKLGITFENIYPDKDNMVKTIRFIKEHM